MTISKGEPWGAPGSAVVELVAADDGELAVAAHRAHLDHRALIAAVAAGDLLRTVGGEGDRRSEPMHFPVDLGLVTLDDDEQLPFVAHVVCRRRWWHGPLVAVMNAAWVGDLYLGPRAHPNDGLLDVTYGSVPIRQRLEAKRRAQSGTHIPHPGLSVERRATWSHDLGRTTPVRIDGRTVGTANRIAVETVADAFVLVV